MAWQKTSGGVTSAAQQTETSNTFKDVGLRPDRVIIPQMPPDTEMEFALEGTDKQG